MGHVLEADDYVINIEAEVLIPFIVMIVIALADIYH
jgi:hypothetical protein